MIKLVQEGSQVKNVVLVHGAWADGSSRNDVVEKLQDNGHVAMASHPRETAELIETAAVATGK